MKALTLIVPGLLWPAHSAHAVSADLKLPGLTELLHGADIRQHPPSTADDMLIASFGLPPETSRARLRALGDGIGSENILCADPVPMVFGREGLLLGTPDSLDITADEAGALVATLNENFCDIGQFVAPHPTRWYLLTQADDWHTHPLSDACGRRVDNYLPRSPLARRLLNEIQMLFHSHPVNAARQAAGRPPINSLWLSGEGTLPAPAAHTQTVCADQALARGLARWAGAALKSPAAPESDWADNTLALLDDAQQACLNLDIDAWREALLSLDERWFQPLAAIRKHIDLKLHLPGDRASLHLHCRPPRIWRAFARRRSFADLLSTLQDA